MMVVFSIGLKLKLLFMQVEKVRAQLLAEVEELQRKKEALMVPTPSPKSVPAPSNPGSVIPSHDCTDDDEEAGKQTI